jgi:hypothetical protein
VARRIPRRYFTLQDHKDGLCDENGIAYPGGARLIKKPEVPIIGQTEASTTATVDEVEVIQDPVETATNDEAQALIDAGAAEVPEEAVVEEPKPLTAKERVAQKKAQQEAVD